MANQVENMESEIEKFRNFADTLASHGLQFVFGMTILIVGVLLTKWIMQYLNSNITKISKNTTANSMIVNTVGIILFGIVITASAIEIGADPKRVVATLMFICLVSIGIIVIFRPLVPTLPFKVGNTVKLGDLLGKVEHTTILNTRVRTFDGKTFFVPNRKILDDVVINYHFTKNRRIKIDITIGYDQDLLKAKQTLESVMRADPRVLNSPAPLIYTLELGSHGVKIGGRCWVPNLKFWPTKCDLTEKIKYAFDLNNISFAYPQLDIHTDVENTSFRNKANGSENSYIHSESKDILG